MFVDDAQFDRLLRAALLEAARQDFPEEEMDGEPLEYSPAHRRWERRFWKDPFRYARKHCRPVWKRVARTAALIAFTLLVTAASIFTLFPSARAWITQIFLEWHEKYTTFFFPSSIQSSHFENEVVISGTWQATYLPANFELADVHTTPELTMYTYLSSNGQYLYLSCLLASSNPSYIDNEKVEYYDVLSKDGKDYYLIRANTASVFNTIIWFSPDQQTTFVLESELSIDELLTVAESVTFIP